MSSSIRHHHVGAAPCGFYKDHVQKVALLHSLHGALKGPVPHLSVSCCQSVLGSIESNIQVIHLVENISGLLPSLFVYK